MSSGKPRQLGRKGTWKQPKLSQNKKFAIISSLDTTRPVTYSHRPSGLPKTQHHIASRHHPLNQTLSTFSQSSFQQCIIDYDKGEPSDTTNPRSSLDLYESSEEILTEEDKGEKGIMKVDVDMTKIIAELDVDLSLVSSTESHFQSSVESQTQSRSFIESQTHSNTSISDMNTQSRASLFEVHSKTTQTETHPRTTPGLSDDISTVCPRSSTCTSPSPSHISHETVGVASLCNQEDVQGNDCTFSEYLAYSKEPLSLADVLNVQSASLTTRPATKEKYKRETDTRSLTTCQKPTFNVLPASIHQFCTSMTSYPQLPLQLQILSHKSHTRPVSSLDYNKTLITQDKVQSQVISGGPTLAVCGVVMPVENDPMRLLWASSPPKLALYPLTIKQQLCPQYIEEVPVTEDIEIDVQDRNEDHIYNTSLSLISEPTVLHTSNLSGVVEQEEEKEHVEKEKGEEKEMTAKLDSYDLYKMNMSEVVWQREQLIDSHKRRIEEEEQMRQTKDNDEDEDLINDSVDSESDKYNSSSVFTTSSLLRHAIRRAGQKRKGVSTPAKTRPTRKTKSALMRTQYVRLEVSKPPRQLKHSLSYPSVSFELDKSIIIQEPIKQYRHSRSGSLPLLLDFDALFVAKGQSSKTTPYKWAESLWDQWFYEVLAEVRAALAELNRGRRPLVLWQPRPQATSKQKEDKVVDKKIYTTKQSSLEKVELAVIPSLVSLDNQMFQNEVEQLTNQIEACKIQKDKASELAEYLSQRGSLYRKNGELRKAMNDFNEASSLSKSIIQPHWERHLLYLIQGEEKLAADELTVLLKKDRKHILAFISKATLLVKRGELSDAIQNYTQAIWLESDNPRLYFLRAELREKRGEIEAAVSDYSTVVQLQPHNEEALIRQAKHKFNKNLWRATTQTLTSLLAINHSNTEAWLLRSQAQLQMGNYEAALQDLSAAIHLNPTNATLFYQRGCLLRGHNPERALHDFSISVLLDSSKSNAVSFLYRGIVYTQMKCYDEALKDFLTARELDMSLASAHTNAGLVIMNYHNNSRVAVKHFTAGLLADPTYIRALLCRAEAFTKLNKLQEAILDWSRAIHMYPSDPSLHLNQGKVHLLLEDYTSAIGCIRTASKLDSGVGSSPDQKALVHSFLGEHQEAIAKLSGVRGRNNAHLHTVLGKVQLRARMFSEAAASFREALKFHNQLYPSSNETQALTIELHFLCGQSLLKAGQFREASEEFGRVIMSEANHVMAHYYRGVSLLKLGHNRGMMSISQALVLKPDLVKGYLTRAAYYGQHNRHSKAILNCSEAIRLQPKSVRAYLYRGVLRHQMGYHNAAIADLSMAISLSPTHSVLALYNRAICHHTIGNIDQALNDYSVVCLLEDTPNYRVLVNRGLLYLSINDYHNALSDFRTARNVLSDDPLLWQAAALCYHKLGNLKDAIKCYSQALKLDSSFTEAYIGRANVYTEYLTIEGNQKAKIDYISVLHQYPDCLPARINLALLLQCEGHYMLAWKQLTCILAIEKDYPPALEARAIISLQMGNTFGALLDISRALTLHPTAQYFTERGAIHHYTGDIINAVRDYEKAIQLDSTYILAQYNLGNILLQQRLYKQGIDKYSKVLALVPEEDGTLINRALCYIALGERDLALQDLNKAISSNPFAAHAYFNRANIFRAQERYQEAEQDYRQALELQPFDSLTLNYHGDVLGLLGERDAAREQFIAAAQLEI